MKVCSDAAIARRVGDGRGTGVAVEEGWDEVRLREGWRGLDEIRGVMQLGGWDEVRGKRDSGGKID